MAKLELKAYAELTKPRALFMIVFTTALSYMIAAPVVIDWITLLHTCIGVALGGGGSLALNQHMERNLDAQMKRTKTRPIPSGRINPKSALIYGWTMMLVGYLYLWFLVNPLASLSTIACGASYLWWYTPMKRTSSFSSFVGAIPGGLLPIMGWTAAVNRLELGAWVLFAILWLWQIPHALIISQRHKDDYESVGMKQLPIIATALTTKRQMMLNVLILIPITILPGLINITNRTYPIVAAILGLGLFVLTLRYVTRGSESDAKRVFIGLSAYLPLLFIAMYLDKPAL